MSNLLIIPDLEYIRENPENVDWYKISKSGGLSEDFMEEFNHKIIWPLIAMSQKLSKEFIFRHRDKIHWFNVIRYQEVTEDFLRQNPDLFDQFDWHAISCYITLSLEFIKEFAHNIDWRWALEHQPNLQHQDDFIIEHMNYVVQDQEMTPIQSQTLFKALELNLDKMMSYYYLCKTC